MRKIAVCYSAKFVRSVSWRFTEQNRRGLTLFSINLIRFLKLHSAEEELEQKEKAYTRLSKCPVSELHYINCWQLWITSEILQVENRGEGCLHRTDLCRPTQDWVLYAHRCINVHEMVMSLSDCGYVYPSLPCAGPGHPVCCSSILIYPDSTMGQYWKPGSFTVCPQVWTNRMASWHRVRAELCSHFAGSFLPPCYSEVFLITRTAAETENSHVLIHTCTVALPHCGKT